MEKNISLELFTSELLPIIDTLYNQQFKNIDKAALICADSVAKGGVIQVFGSGHSIGFGLEMMKRPGSLVPVHNIDMSDFVRRGQVTYEDFRNPDDIFERRPGIAGKLYNLYNIKPEDAFIIISNSGINGVVIDLAIHAKSLGHKIIIVTSWQHTTAEESRHPSGKKLYELGDVIIDNCGPRGDALIETGEVEKICSISSITGAFIAQTIGSETCEYLIEKGTQPPVLWSKEKEDYQKHNEDLIKQYQDRI